MDVNSPQKNLPIALEMIKLVNVIGLNKCGEKMACKQLQFQGIVNSSKNRKVTMTAMRLTFDKPLIEMTVGLRCSLSAQNRCTFDGKINIKKAKVFAVARQVRIRKNFETVENNTRNAVGYITMPKQYQNLFGNHFFKQHQVRLCTSHL